MKKYAARIPLFYNKYPYIEENPQITDELTWSLKDAVHCSIVQYSELKDNEQKNAVNVTIKSIDSNFFVEMDGILTNESNDVDNDNEALYFIRRNLETICQKISFLAQIELGYSDKFHVYFFWRDRNIQLSSIGCNDREEYREEKSEDNLTKIHINDSFNMKDLENTINCLSLDMQKFSNIDDLVEKNSTFKFMLEAYYAALGDNDFASKYYRLFTIVEYLEQNFVNKKKFDKLVPKDIANCALESVMQIVENWLNKDENDEGSRKDISDRINSRLNNILKTATLKSRDEKLLCFLIQDYGISRIKGLGNTGELNVSKIHEFTKMRNSLFHGKGYEKQDLQKLTNELMLLCQQIMQIELDKSEENKNNKAL